MPGPVNFLQGVGSIFKTGAGTAVDTAAATAGKGALDSVGTTDENGGNIGADYGKAAASLKKLQQMAQLQIDTDEKKQEISIVAGIQKGNVDAWKL